MEILKDQENLIMGKKYIDLTGKYKLLLSGKYTIKPAIIDDIYIAINNNLDIGIISSYTEWLLYMGAEILEIGKKISANNNIEIYGIDKKYYSQILKIYNNFPHNPYLNNIIPYSRSLINNYKNTSNVLGEFIDTYNINVNIVLDILNKNNRNDSIKKYPI